MSLYKAMKKVDALIAKADALIAKRDAKDPTYIRASNNEYIGKQALAREHEKEKIKQLMWEYKNMRPSMSNEDIEFLKSKGKIK